MDLKEESERSAGPDLLLSPSSPRAHTKSCSPEEGVSGFGCAAALVGGVAPLPRRMESFLEATLETCCRPAVACFLSRRACFSLWSCRALPRRSTCCINTAWAACGRGEDREASYMSG